MLLRLHVPQYQSRCAAVSVASVPCLARGCHLLACSGCSAVTWQPGVLGGPRRRAARLGTRSCDSDGNFSVDTNTKPCYLGVAGAPARCRRGA
jgi:hypothetical protein